MERQLFDWQNWIRGDDGHYTFFDCVLRQDIGFNKAGEKIDRIDAFADGRVIIKDQVHRLCPINIKPTDAE